MTWMNFLTNMTNMNKIKKTKRQHQLWTEHQHLNNVHPNHGIPQLSGRWYYTYSNDIGMTVGLAKLMDTFYMIGKHRRKWMWETCMANEELELCRFPTQKAAEKEIYKFLS